MKVCVFGIGDIAKKAYLPVLSQMEDVDLVLCTRNEETLCQVAKKYHIKETYSNIDEALENNIDVAFINSATEAHYELALKCINKNIHTYIDKPISCNFKQTKEIYELSKKHNVKVMVGFNRRYIPMYENLIKKGKPSLIFMNKNRDITPTLTRSFITDDFIHVIDTIRFLLQEEIKDIKITYKKQQEKLEHVIVTFITENSHAVGIMNHNHGVTEETIEYVTNNQRFFVKDTIETTSDVNKIKTIDKFKDWVPTLEKRGFYQIVDQFIDAIKKDKEPYPSIEDSFTTHVITEYICKYIEEDN